MELTYNALIMSIQIRYLDGKKVCVGFWMVVFCVLAGAVSGHGQPGKLRIDYNKVYEMEISRLLLPRNAQESKAPLIAAFLVHPMVYPDYSICLKDSAGRQYLEMRTLDKNINYELQSKLFQRDSSALQIKVDVYKVLVNKRLRNKIIWAYDQIKPIEQSNTSILWHDETSYEFITVKNGTIRKVPVSYELKPESYEYNLVNLLALICSDMKKKTFRESYYLRKF